jgi:hypothetical protein
VLSLVVSSGCAPLAPPYARCGDGVACDGSRCVELLYTLDDGSEVGGLFCTARCARDEDCPDGGVCVSVDASAPMRFVCAQRCELPSDCYARSACTELVGPTDLDRVCLPTG